MQALVYAEVGQPLEYHTSVPDPIAQEGETIVNIRAAALNHRDVYITQGLYPGVVTPIILGSDGAGIHEGREVLINPSINWGDNPRVQGRSYQILGLPKPGTMAQQVAVPAENIVSKPAHLSWEQAAALPLAGLTAYRALFTQGQCEQGQKVLISGVGGGVALFAFQFALATGAEVYVTSGSADKRGRAEKMGAKGSMDYNDTGWGKALGKETGGFDVIIDSAGGTGFQELFNAVRPGGRIVMYGGTRGKIEAISPQKLFWKQVSIIGSSMGTGKEFTDMVNFVDQHKVEPVVDSVFSLKDGQQAFDRMAAGLQFGKIVLTTD